MGDKVDYMVAPAEDFAQGTVRFADESGREMVVPAINSWVYVGAGLRIHFEALGPEYAFESDSLASGASIFFSRKVDRAPGGDLLEKQNAEQGLLPLYRSAEEARTVTLPDPTLEEFIPLVARGPERRS